MRAFLVLALLSLWVALDVQPGRWLHPKGSSLGGGLGLARAETHPSATPRASLGRTPPPQVQGVIRATPVPRSSPAEKSTAGEPGSRRGRPVTLRGEIVELAGFLREGRRGAGHRAESLAAVRGGGALALVEDDTGDLYLLAGDTPASQPNDLAHDLVAEHVVATGTEYERAGCRVLVPTAVDRLDR